MGYNNGIPIGSSREPSVSAYQEGLRLEEKHRCQAAAQYYFRQAAEGGYVPAMLRVAGFYLTGSNLMQDGSEALHRQKDVDRGVTWIRKAAYTGDSTALYMLARCFIDGIGLVKDRDAAAYYIEQVHFPETMDNPYELKEALVFGSISTDLTKLIRELKGNIKSASGL